MSEHSAIQVEPEHYEWASYNTQGRWASYWHQIRAVLESRPASCLVVGPGDGTVPAALRHLGIEVMTLDIDARLDPELVGDVRSIPLPDDAVDVSVCAQVLEHIPLGEVGSGLRELARVTRQRVIVSVPQRGRMWRLGLRLPYLPPIAAAGVLPARTPHTFDGQHHWELGASNSRRRVVEDLLSRCFVIEQTFTVFEHPYHRFYLLRPSRAASAP